MRDDRGQVRSWQIYPFSSILWAEGRATLGRQGRAELLFAHPTQSRPHSIPGHRPILSPSVLGDTRNPVLFEPIIHRSFSRVSLTCKTAESFSSLALRSMCVLHTKSYMPLSPTLVPEETQALVPWEVLQCSSSIRKSQDPPRLDSTEQEKRELWEPHLPCL